MTKENQNLLLIDLCARLPYNVKVCYDNKVCTIDAFAGNSFIISETPDAAAIVACPKDIKPYLFPLSSITDEQRKELEELYLGCYITCQDVDDDGYIWDEKVFEMFPGTETDDWLNANHFDYRGFINKGLAIDATNLNIYGKRI